MFHQQFVRDDELTLPVHGMYDECGWLNMSNTAISILLEPISFGYFAPLDQKSGGQEKQPALRKECHIHMPNQGHSAQFIILNKIKTTTRQLQAEFWFTPLSTLNNSYAHTVLECAVRKPIHGDGFQPRRPVASFFTFGVTLSHPSFAALTAHQPRAAKIPRVLECAARKVNLTRRVNTLRWLFNNQRALYWKLHPSITFYFAKML